MLAAISSVSMADQIIFSQYDGVNTWNNTYVEVDNAQDFVKPGVGFAPADPGSEGVAITPATDRTVVYTSEYYSYRTNGERVNYLDANGERVNGDGHVGAYLATTTVVFTGAMADQISEADAAQAGVAPDSTQVEVVEWSRVGGAPGQEAASGTSEVWRMETEIRWMQDQEHADYADRTGSESSNAIVSDVAAQDAVEVPTWEQSLPARAIVSVPTGVDMQAFIKDFMSK